MNALPFILEHKIVAILRGMPPAQVVEIGEALYAGGVRLMEITLNSENPFDCINALSNKMKGRMSIGAGTVLSAVDARKAIDAGASFIISPNTDAEVIQATKDAGAVSIPGAFTPTEIVHAHQLGADIVKVFPNLGVEYIKNILAPLNHIKLLPSGGIDASNIQSFARAGASAFGIGSALVKYKSAMSADDLQAISVNAITLVAALHRQ